MEDSEKHLKESSEKVEQLQSKCYNISFYVSRCLAQLKTNIYWAFNSFVNPPTPVKSLALRFAESVMKFFQIE